MRKALIPLDGVDQSYRYLSLTCGGCCGRATHRKLALLAKSLAKKEGIGNEGIVVQLSSCITNDNYHAPPCPHLAYLKKLIDRLGLDLHEGTYIYDKSEQRRQSGTYRR